MLKSFGNELISDELLKPGDAVVVGVSGGRDSMALLYLLVGLNRTPDWDLKLHVAYLDHKLRGPGGERDGAFVQAVADGLNIPCTIGERDVPKIANERKAGVEEVGRHERYGFFERVCIAQGASIVAVGHHADDNAETILQRVLRGTGVRGLAGIRRKRLLNPTSELTLIRPLLRHTRAELLAYLSDQGVAYRDDPTNEDNDLLRNRIRNRILPILADEVNPQVREALIRLGEQAQWTEEYLRETVERTFETLIISRTDQMLTLNADALARKSRIVQSEIIRLAYRSFGLGEQDLAFAHLVSALDLIADQSSGKQVQLPGGMTIEKRYRQLIFSLPTDEPREEIALEIAVHVPGNTVLPIRRLQIECSLKQIVARDVGDLRRTATKMEEFVDFEAVHAPLIVRGRRPGDRFVPLGAPGSKKLADFLIDAKVSPKARQRVAILCDQLGPIWIIGHRLDDRVKMTELTRQVLHLRARPLDS